MTKDETLKILSILKAAYPGSYNGMSKKEAAGTVAVWCIQFSDVPWEIVLMALNKAISTSKFPPTISEVKAKLSGIHWEAYEAIRQNELDQIHTPEALKMFQWIYDETKEFRHGKATEPPISQMIGCGSLLQLGPGE